MKLQSRLSNKVCPDNMSIEDWQVALRREHAQDAQFDVEHLDDNRIWGDYLVTSETGKYRTAFRGVRSDRNFCSCLDFRTNGLGTCKHLEAVSLFLEQHVEGYPWAGMTYNPPYSSIYVSYKGGRSIKMRLGEQYTSEYLKLYKKYFDSEGVLPQEHYPLLEDICQQARSISSEFRCYEDVGDFAKECILRRSWQEEVQNSYPEGLIPWDRSQTNELYAPLEHLLYRLCYHYNGLLVGGRTINFAHLLARLIEEIYQGEEYPLAGYVVLDNERDVPFWQNVFAQYSECLALPIKITTSNAFADLIGDSYPSCTFVYVDNADRLKEWKNTVSLTLKRMRIEHLYMRIDSLSKLTPVQLSSILQHINPFVIGPFYKFIHKYRPIFPLLDDGSNMPQEAEHLITCATMLPSLTIEPPDANLREMVPPAPRTSQEKARHFIDALVEVLDDAEALSIIKDKIRLL